MLEISGQIEEKRRVVLFSTLKLFLDNKLCAQ